MSRRIWDIPGGIHPPENKSLSTQHGIGTVALPDKLVISLRQHIGSPSKPIVNVGDHVLKGQKIADATGFVSAPVHASSSGTVTDIADHPIQHPSQMTAPCIIIEPDGEDRWIEKQGIDNYRKLDPDTLKARIREAGIIGLGGAGFPTAIKMSPSEDVKIDTLILNAMECEPYITADDMLLRTHADEVIEGLKVMAYLVQPKICLIGIEDNKPLAAKALEEAITRLKEHDKRAGLHNDIEIKVVITPTKYPSGGEKQIIQILTGREVPSGGIPADIGVVCQNAGTAFAVHRAIGHGEPVVSRITTLTGTALDTPQNVQALIGTPVRHLLAQSGIQQDKLHRVVMGGPMMGFTIHNPEVPITKTTNCLIAGTAQDLPSPKPEQPCIRCGACASACPASLLPQQLYWFSKGKEFDKAQDFNLFDCIECGACAYVCPSHIPLVQYFRFAKGEIRKAEIESANSDRARERFEARKARIEREEAEKEAKRKARAKAAAAKQAAKKAAASKADANAAKADSSEKDADKEVLTKLQTTAAKSMKRYKEAAKALEAARTNTPENIDLLEEKVKGLKAKADAAKLAFEQAKTQSKDKPAVAANNTKTNNKDEALEKLKAQSAQDFQAWLSAKSELKALEVKSPEGKNNIEQDAEKIERLKQKVEALKEQSDKTKALVKEARQKQREALQKQKKETPSGSKDLTVQAALARTELKKAQKALALAQVQESDKVEALKTAVEKAEIKAQKFEKLLEKP